MKYEIERKFLVKGEFPQASEVLAIRQGYLTAPGAQTTVRVRIVDGVTAYLTLKGKGNLQRAEYEYPIPLKDAEDLFSLCGAELSKKRHLIHQGTDLWEVDVIEADGGKFPNKVVVAEIELASVDQPITLPPWVGEEVTHFSRYSNLNLAYRGML